MAFTPPKYVPHDESCCGRDPIVGALYRRRKLNLITGEYGDYVLFRVEKVDPINRTKLICRRVHLLCVETGRIFTPQVSNFWADKRYEAIENVVTFPTSRKAGVLQAEAKKSA